MRLILEPREVRALTLSLDVAGVDLRVEVTAEASLPSTHSPSSTDADRRSRGGPAGVSAHGPHRCDCHLRARHDPRPRRFRPRARARDRVESLHQRRVVLGEPSRGVFGGFQPRRHRRRQYHDRRLFRGVREPVRRRHRCRHQIGSVDAERGLRRLRRRRSRTANRVRGFRRPSRALWLLRLRIGIRIRSLSEPSRSRGDS